MEHLQHRRERDGHECAGRADQGSARQHCDEHEQGIELELFASTRGEMTYALRFSSTNDARR